MHIVWDWNGTLLADVEAVVAACNHELARHGATPLTLEEYRTEFARPVRGFNERRIGRALTDEEWTALDAGFHEHYWGAVESIPLAAEAVSCLARVASLGWTQSLLSMAPHHHVADIVVRRGLGSHLLRVDGNHGEVGASKKANLQAHLAELDVPATEVWLIGDALDDAVSAAAVGAHAVLVAEHSCHSPAVLRGAGAPVVATLAEAVALVESRA